MLLIISCCFCCAAKVSSHIPQEPYWSAGIKACVTATQVSKPLQENWVFADSLISSSSVNNHVGELSFCAVMVASSISVNELNHCIVTGPSPEVSYFGI